MTSAERFQRLDALFRAAAAMRGPSERREFLARECADDPELMREVLALLAEDSHDRGVLDSPAFGAASITDVLARTESDPPMPQSIGGYRIVRVLGRGGMGVVYEAIQDQPHRTVALKVIAVGIPSHTVLRRFARESELLGRLQHPGIASIFEAGTFDAGAGSQPFFAMELVRGRPLAEFARAEGLSQRAKLELVASICDAIDHAHQRGVVHRDLKPSNILIDESGQPRILDFGIARASDVDVHAITVATDAGQLVGTIPYMSPEQASGYSAEIDGRSDVYSLGVIAYELLAGRFPQDVGRKPIHEAVRAIREDDPTPLSSVDRSLRGDVSTIVGRALEKDRVRRYQSAGELARDIRRYLADRPIAASPPSTFYRLRKFARRNKAIVAGVAVGFALMSIGLVSSLREAREARLAQGLAERKSAEATRHWVRASLAAAALEVDVGNVEGAVRRLAEVAPADRSFEWHYLDSMLDDSVAHIADDNPIVGAILMPDGRETLTLSTKGVLKRWDTRQAVVLESTQLCDTPVLRAAFSSDGRRVLAAVESEGVRLRVFDRGGSAPYELATLRWQPRILEVSPHGRWGIVCLGAIGTELFDLDARTRRDLPLGATVQGATFARDDAHVLLAFTGAVRIVDCETGAVLRALTIDNGGMDADRSSDGRWLVTGGVDKALHAIDLTDEQKSTRLLGHLGSVRGVRILDNQAQIVSVGQDSTLRLWDLETGTSVRKYRLRGMSAWELSIDANGSNVLTRSSDGGVDICDLRSGHDDWNVLRHDGYVYAVAFTPDGRRMVTGGWDRAIRTWDSATLAPLKVMRDDHGFVTALAVSPDGRVIVSGHHVDAGRPAMLRAWDSVSGELLRDFGVQLGEAKSIAFEPTGKRFAIMRTHTPVMVFDLKSGSSAILDPTRTTKGTCLDWAHDGKRIAACYRDGVVRILDAGSGEILRESTVARTFANACAFSGDDRFLATGLNDGTIRVFDVESGDCVQTMVGHTDVAYAVAFSPDNSRLASGSRDATVRLWDVASGDEMLQLRGHTQYVHALAFSPDGSTLLSGSGDGTARVWDTRPMRTVEQARAASR